VEFSAPKTHRSNSIEDSEREKPLFARKHQPWWAGVVFEFGSPQKGRLPLA